MALVNSVDVLLAFPPQWSPFQPPLSIPSLRAWLVREGYSVRSCDLNVLFYQWLLSDECAELLTRHVQHGSFTIAERCGYEATFEKVGDFRTDITNVLEAASRDREVSDDEFISRYYIANKSLESYLATISEVYPEFVVSPYEFTLTGGNLDRSVLERMVENPPDVIKAFCRAALERHIKCVGASAIGFSCIGQEQLFFTLLLGGMLKQDPGFDTPILVGGTIFSRIFERGNLDPRWFHRYFDVIVRNEGERPLEAIIKNLKVGAALTAGVPGIIFGRGDSIESTVPARPLAPKDLPVPDFDELPLEGYFSSSVTLPILASRGCYWGKCEFCHHGMVYGEKYEAYQVDSVLHTVARLSEKYGVSHFAFNDEALPPKLIRHIGNKFPPRDETHWNFTALMKFEKIYRREDFQRLYDVGFRSLYVGLESGSERVLALMRKNNTQETMTRNLQDSSAANVWMHCFLFFGFPGETAVDAQETYDFVLRNADVIGSIGVGTFSLEHNAPIYHHLDKFGLRLKPTSRDDVDVYYDYEVKEGLGRRDALDWADKLNDAASCIPQFDATSWIPREHLLCLLSRVPRDRITEFGRALKDHAGLPPQSAISRIISIVPEGKASSIVVNRSTRRVYRMTGAEAEQVEGLHDHGNTIQYIRDNHNMLFRYVGFKKHLAEHDALAAN